jgi:hypothetical protein
LLGAGDPTNWLVNWFFAGKLRYPKRFTTCHCAGSRFGVLIQKPDTIYGHSPGVDVIAHCAVLYLCRLPRRLAELQRGKLRIERRVVKQIRVTAPRDDAALLQHDNAVGLLYGSEAMRDDQRRAILRGIVQRPLDQSFTGGIERAGSLVEQQDGRILQDRAGNRDALICGLDGATSGMWIPVYLIDRDGPGPP